MFTGIRLGIPTFSNSWFFMLTHLWASLKEFQANVDTYIRRRFALIQASINERIVTMCTNLT